jgi:hypothetical protein
MTHMTGSWHCTVHARARDADKQVSRHMRHGPTACGGLAPRTRAQIAPLLPGLSADASSNAFDDDIYQGDKAP